MKTIMMYVMVVLYVAAGIMHFLRPLPYIRIMPPWLPAPAALVLISGICELVFALLLLPVATRHIAAWLLIAMLIAIFPANVQMAVNYWQRHSASLWLAIVRLPLQLVLIWWAWLYTK